MTLKRWKSWHIYSSYLGCKYRKRHLYITRIGIRLSWYDIIDRSGESILRTSVISMNGIFIFISICSFEGKIGSYCIEQERRISHSTESHQEFHSTVLLYLIGYGFLDLTFTHCNYSWQLNFCQFLFLM